MDQTQITLYEITMRVGTKHVYRHLQFKHPELFALVQSQGGKRFIERLYRAVYGLPDYPECVECGKKITKFRSFRKGYAFFCSNKCVAVNAAHKKKKKETSEDRFGTDNPAKAKEVDEKRRKTLLERYGTDNIAEIKWRRKQKKK